MNNLETLKQIIKNAEDIINYNNEIIINKKLSSKELDIIAIQLYQMNIDLEDYKK